MPKLTPFPQQSHFAIILHLLFAICYSIITDIGKKSKIFSKINPGFQKIDRRERENRAKTGGGVLCFLKKNGNISYETVDKVDSLLRDTKRFSYRCYRSDMVRIRPLRGRAHKI